MNDDIRFIVENTLIPHTAFQKAISRIEQCFQHAYNASEPSCIAIIGESRTGKSRVLEECYLNHKSFRIAEGLNVPILRVKAPSNPTVKGLVEELLRAIGDPKSNTGTEITKTYRLITLMRAANTSMVMIDEFQHFWDKGTHRIMHHVADWLKILVDETKTALVVAGLPTCRAVLEQNEQLAGRFLSPIVMPRFDWKISDHREEYIAILGAFQESIGNHFDLVKLNSDDMAFRCYCGTGGLMGYLTKFLRQAVWNAMDNNKASIPLEDLERAHQEAVWNIETILDIKNPFNRNFKLTESKELLARVITIGTSVIEDTQPTRQFKSRDKNNSVQNILTTRSKN